MPLCVLPLSPVCVRLCIYATGNIKPCYAAVTYALSALSLNFNFQEATESAVFHIQNSNNVIKRMHYCHPLCGAAVCIVSAWKAEGGQDESDNVPRSSVKAAKWPYSLGRVCVCVCDINTICLPLCCSMWGGHRVYATDSEAAELSPVWTSTAQPHSTQPALIHHHHHWIIVLPIKPGGNTLQACGRL